VCKKTIRAAALMTACVAGAFTAGCDTTDRSNLSPTPDQAVDRHQQAIRYTEELASKNQQAERKVMSRMARPRPRQ
jgi:hypothetical protein